MVAGGQNVAAEIKELVGDGRCKPESASRVFGVGNHQVHLVRFYHVAQVVAHDLAPRAAEYVTYKENLHEYLILTSAICADSRISTTLGGHGIAHRNAILAPAEWR